MAVSLNYLCHFLEAHTRCAGQWSSSDSFGTHYLLLHLHDMPWETVGFLPLTYSPTVYDIPVLGFVILLEREEWVQVNFR